jgi:hypothetical protein
MVVFQLALGLQVATAGGAVHASSAAAAQDHDCPLHDSSPKPATDQHGCCKLSGSQCQCGSLALAVDRVVSSGVATRAFVLPARVALPASVPAESRFRPPIAS